MKNLLFVFVATGALFFSSCDKVDNPFPPAVNVDLDTTIYDGTWSDYVANEWPTAADFDAMPDETRNALIEDFTGHNCSFCPAAGEIAHNIHDGNPSKIFIASIHASNTTDGMSSFQAVNEAQGYTIDFTNSNGLEYGSYFGTVLSSSGFFGNPAGTISRTNDAGEYFPASGQWQTKTDAVLATSLKVAVKAKVNYYESPKHGYFLHAEVEKLDASITNDLAMVVYMIEDTLVGPQNVSNVFTPNYVHRDIMRGCIDGQTWGRTLTADMMTGDKYYINYSGIIPDQLVPEGSTVEVHNAENMHLLIYVYDKVTLEIYQVIKRDFN